MLKKLVLILGLAIILLVIAIIVVVSTADYNKFKPVIIQKAKDIAGLDVKIDGDIKPSFYPIGLKVDGLSVINPKDFGNGEMFKLGSFSVVLEFKPLLSGKVVVDHFLFSDIDANIIKSKNGKFNFDVAISKSEETANNKTNIENSSNTTLPSIKITTLKFKNINVLYNDLQSNVTAKINNLNININNIIFENNDLILKGNINAKKIAFDKYEIDDMKGRFSFKDKVAYLESLEYILFGSHANSALTFNLKNEHVQLTQAIKGLDMQKVGKVLMDEDIFSGKANMQTSLSFIGTNPNNIKKTLSGTFNLDATNLHVNGYDIDSIIEQFKNSENFLTNISSLKISNETKKDIKNTSHKISNGATLVQQLNMDIPINQGKAEFKDVAFATSKTLVALKGNLNLPNESFNNIKVGILNKNNCAQYLQTIGGTFSNPKIIFDESSVKTVVNVAEKVVGLFKKDKEEKAEQKNSEEITCTEPFYSGVVINPKR